MRIVGAFLIIIGCTGMGIWYRENFIGRIKALRLLQTVLAFLESEIDYGHETLPEACGRIAFRMPGELGKALEMVAIKMRENTGESFNHIFQGQLRDILEKLPLKEEDRNDFFLFVSDMGYADEKLQLKLLQSSSELLKEKTDMLNRDKNEKCRMAVGLGVLGGFLLILVLC